MQPRPEVPAPPREQFPRPVPAREELLVVALRDLAGVDEDDAAFDVGRPVLARDLVQALLRRPFQSRGESSRATSTKRKSTSARSARCSAVARFSVALSQAAMKSSSASGGTANVLISVRVSGTPGSSSRAISFAWSPAITYNPRLRASSPRSCAICSGSVRVRSSPMFLRSMTAWR